MYKLSKLIILRVFLHRNCTISLIYGICNLMFRITHSLTSFHGKILKDDFLVYLNTLFLLLTVQRNHAIYKFFLQVIRYPLNSLASIGLRTDVDEV